MTEDQPPPIMSFEAGRISRTQLALFAGGSGDHNPIHIDIDAAREAGFDDVVAPGMLLMAQMGRMLCDRVGRARLRRWSVRFTTITPVNMAPVYLAEVVEQVSVAGEPCLRLALSASVDGGESKCVIGEALVALS